jgi:hypothetical protein
MLVARSGKPASRSCILRFGPATAGEDFIGSDVLAEEVVGQRDISRRSSVNYRRAMFTQRSLPVMPFLPW